MRHTTPLQKTVYARHRKQLNTSTLDDVTRRQVLLESLVRWGRTQRKPTGMQVASRTLESLHRVMSGLFDQQRQVVADQSRRLALFCPRRAGKTSLLAPWIVQTGLDCSDNEATMFIIAPTLEHAKALYWRPLQNLNEQFNIGLKFLNDPARVIFPNGVMMYFRGAKDKEQLGVLRGFKTLLVCVDETQDIRDELISEMLSALGPGLRDLDGRMIFAGTPGRVCIGHWFDITTGLRDEWSIHTWSLFDNPALPKSAKNVETILREEGLTVDSPRFKREYLGLWVEDGDELVYRWDLERNGLLENVPRLDPNLHWDYVMGIDFGYLDASAIVVGAFSYDSDQYYEVAEFKAPGLTVSDLMNKHVMPFVQQYKPMRIVGDSAAKQIIEEINQRWGIGIQKAEKVGKLSFIELMNSDMMLRRIHTPVNFELIKERQRLVWDPGAKPKLEEHPRRPNHLCDAALYCYREAKHWVGKNLKKAQEITDPVEREVYFWKKYIREQGGAALEEKPKKDWARDDDFY